MQRMRAEVRGGGGPALGLAGGHGLAVDRPEGRAGGTGAGFNGGNLLCLALAGCLANDLHYAAEELGEQVADLQVTAEIRLAGQPARVVGAHLACRCVLASGAPPEAVIARARDISTVVHSLEPAFPIGFGPA